MCKSDFMKRAIGCGALCCFFVNSALAQRNDSILLKQELGEVVVVGNTAPSRSENITSLHIEMHEKEDIADALNLLPGVLNVRGAKADQVFVRGFNQKQVPVYFDGVPIYIPYDGTLDLDMLMATDVSKISVVKGAGTMLYGPNALGGAINIITSKPSMGFSAKAKLGSYTDGKYNALLSLGYATDKYYIKGAYAIIDKKDFRLPDNYEPTKSIESGGHLDNSYKKMAQLSAKIGWTPAEGHEYVFSYVKHDGEKGIPPYLGSEGSARFWQFPIYDKESFYFLSNSRLSSAMKLKTRIYYDKFDNTLESYDDSTYSTQKKKSAFTSIYDDYSYGVIATLSHTYESNVLMFDAQYKYDDHKEHNVGDPVQQMTDKSASLSLIDRYDFDQLTLQGGVSLNYQKGLNAEYLDQNGEVTEYSKNSATAYNGEVSASYKVTPLSEIRAGISYKTRFPTMKDRYSQSFGKSIPNPDLKDENSLNYTLDYSNALFNNKLKVEAGLFYSSLKDAILSVYGVDASDATIYQYQNTGKAEYYGFDASATYSIIKPLDIRANYSFVKRKNKTNPDDKFTGVPENSFQADLIYSFRNASYVDLNFEAYSDRYSSSTGLKVGGFGLLNIKAGCYVYKNIVRLETGVNNILDKNYEVAEGYPMPGRSGFASVVVTL